jgi:hypothetical protein
MDLEQTKLSRQEWNNLETPVSDEEKTILDIIDKGYDNMDLSTNKNLSLNQLLKIEVTESIDLYLYNKYFKKDIDNIQKKYGITKKEKDDNVFKSIKLQKIKSADMVRLQNIDNTIERNHDIIFECTLIDLYKTMLKCYKKQDNRYVTSLYTLMQLLNTNIRNVNKNLKNIILTDLNTLKDNIELKQIINEAYIIIEKNPYILDYQDIELFEHQKKIYSFYKEKEKINPSLVLYKAPTGTGKTMTPIGLSNEYKIIFVCVARHIGLALAKSAISMRKKIAFGFGCEYEEQIRLHNNSAKSFHRHIQNYHTGECSCGRPIKFCKATDGSYITFKDGSRKIDNSDGSEVDIMICDVKSYLTCMNYMLQFNQREDIITFWDEPTITLDNTDHELHPILSNNWRCNVIPNLILSCATLPQYNEIHNVIDSFKKDWGYNTIVEDITSYDFKKSIPIINKDLKYVNIHTLYDYTQYNEMQNCISYVRNNYTLLRYFELNSIIKFINACIKKIDIQDNLKLHTYFNNEITNIKMNSIKMYYIDLIDSLSQEQYKIIYTYLAEKGTLNKLAYTDKSKGVQFTTSDAHTLTDGPTIFLCNDIEKISKFYLQQSKIPDDVFKTMLVKITKNDKIMKEIENVEKLIANKEEKNSVSNIDDGKSKRSSADIKKVDKEDQEWYNKINRLRKDIMLITLDSKYVPNTVQHQEIWCDKVSNDRFVPKIDEVSTKKIMSLDIDNTLKVLLLLGIGVFMKHSTVDYTEFMKQLAIEQKLFIIIASSDYIYGTNYQFCHGIIGKDLSDMTQQKTLQSIGRVGRNKIQQTYSVRFRDDELIYKLFNTDNNNIEARNMVKLFTNE